MEQRQRGFFSRKSGEPPTPGEIEEDAPSGAELGKSFDSVASTSQEKANRSSISWTSFMKKSRKGDKAASEASEKASETEMTMMSDAFSLWVVTYDSFNSANAQ
jgi:hypothetical protein